MIRCASAGADGRSRATRGRWAIAIALAVVCLVLEVLATTDPRWHALFDYQRIAIGQGEYWRLLTGHVMHLSTPHAVLDVAGLLLITWIFGSELDARLWWLGGLLAIAAIDLALWTLHPEVDRYVGLSGLLHAWFVAGAFAWATGVRRVARLWGCALLAGIGIKLMLEAGQHAFWLEGAEFDVVTAAHRWGAAAGLLYGVIRRWTSPPPRDAGRGRDASRGRPSRG